MIVVQYTKLDPAVVKGIWGNFVFRPAITQALLPARAAVERVPCSSPDHAPDLVARLNGTGRGRVLLVGHVDTVVSHDVRWQKGNDEPRALDVQIDPLALPGEQFAGVIVTYVDSTEHRAL